MAAKGANLPSHVNPHGREGAKPPSDAIVVPALLAIIAFVATTAILAVTVLIAASLSRLNRERRMGL